MYYKNISSKLIIADLYRDFRPSSSSWTVDAIEWIGRGMEIIGHCVGYELRPIVHKVNDYKTRLKCEVDSIELIEYKGKRLPPNDSVSANQIDKSKNRFGDWYFLNPNYVQTSFQCGEITIYANVVPVDCDGFPLVPDEPLHKEALAWWCMSKMLSRGYIHPVFKYNEAWQKWLFYYPQAQNAGAFPSIDQMETFRKRWTALLPSYTDVNRFFDNDSIVSPADDTIMTTQDNIRTIIHITDEDEDDNVIGGATI